jgi:hypothetical protein
LPPEELENLSKNECVSTPAAEEVNEIIATIKRLSSIECSSSTGACQNLVQVLHNPFIEHSSIPELMGSQARQPDRIGCGDLSGRLWESGKNPMWRGFSGTAIFIGFSFVNIRACLFCGRITS